MSITKATGSTADISPFLRFRFCKPVYYKVDDSDFPSHSTEKRDLWVGISKHIDNAMKSKLFTEDIQHSSG